jgi:hypothetical protein
MEQAEDMNETLNKDFSVLTEDNKKKVLEMTKFLVLTQKTIIPKILNLTKIEEHKERLA